MKCRSSIVYLLCFIFSSFAHEAPEFMVYLPLSLDNVTNHKLYGLRASQSHCNSHQSRGYSHLSRVDFQRIFQDTSNEYEILSCYELYAYPNFRAYAQKLSSYEEFILSLKQRIESDKAFRKQTACMPGFHYSFSLWKEKSGFHDFVRAEAQNIIDAKNKNIKHAYNAGLHVTKDNLKKLLDISVATLKDSNDSVFKNRIAERIKAIEHTCRRAQSFDYSSKVSLFGDDDCYAKEFSNTHGTHLDYQLHKELYESRRTMQQLERQFSYNHHIQAIAPVIHSYAAQAKVENDPLVAFQLSDFCHAVTQLCAQGMNILYEASSAIDRGKLKGAKEFVNPERWYDVARGAVHLGILFADLVGQEIRLGQATYKALWSNDLDTVIKTMHVHCLHRQEQIDAIKACAAQTYEKIKAMSWQEVLENGAEIGTTMILDIVAFNALSGFSQAAGRSLVKNLSNAAESGAIFTEQYAVEVAGFGKLIVEEGAEVTNQIFCAMNDKKSLGKKIIKSGKSMVKEESISLAKLNNIKGDISSKGIIRNVSRDLRVTIKQYEEHIFSIDHKKKGIVAAGKDQEAIMNSLYDIIMLVDGKGLLQEGPNQLKVTIGGIENIEIRCFIHNGEALSVNAYISDFARIYGNFVDVAKV